MLVVRVRVVLIWVRAFVEAPFILGAVLAMLALIARAEFRGRVAHTRSGCGQRRGVLSAGVSMAFHSGGFVVDGLQGRFQFLTPADPLALGKDAIYFLKAVLYGALERKHVFFSDVRPCFVFVAVGL